MRYRIFLIEPKQTYLRLLGNLSPSWTVAEWQPKIPVGRWGKPEEPKGMWCGLGRYDTSQEAFEKIRKYQNLHGW